MLCWCRRHAGLCVLRIETLAGLALRNVHGDEMHALVWNLQLPVLQLAVSSRVMRVQGGNPKVNEILKNITDETVCQCMSHEH